MQCSVLITGLNEIVWRRTSAKALTSVRLPNNHDILLLYAKSEDHYWNQDAAFLPYDDDLDEKTEAKYSQTDGDGRRYQLTSLINPSQDRPNLTYEFLGVTRVWRWTRDRMQAAYERGEVVQTKPGAVPRFKRYLDEQRGKPLGDVWTDIAPVNAKAGERLGYPTQKPLALLERLIALACPEGGIVLDPFCGCGTAVHAAHRLNRSWIGIDITCLATNLIKARMKAAFGLDIGKATGEPTTLAEARHLALEDRFQFQCWALGFVGARANDTKRGADGGIDGRLYFQEGTAETRQIIFSVKSGGVQRGDVGALRGVIEREKAQLGVLITLEPPSRQMITEATSAGFYESPWGRHARLQILTVEELIAGKRVDYPVGQYSNVTVRKAPKEAATKAQQQTLPGIAKANPSSSKKRRKKVS